MTLRFGTEICRDLDAALRREWLETNGLGGFASSTIAGLNTRRYHGLLVAATRPPVGRMLLLAKLDETLVFEGRRFDLSANRYPGVIHPQGHRYLKEFRLDPFPVFAYEVESVAIEKRVFMVHGENTVVVEYEVTGGAGCTLEIRPLIAFRDYHALTRRNGALNPAVEWQPYLASVRPYADLPALHVAHNAAGFEATGRWYENVEYAEEERRGLDYREDLFNPCLLRFHGGATVIASTEPRDISEAAILRKAEVARRAAVVAASPSPEPMVRALTAAADQFIVERGDLKTIVAGYPWFSDWGRDTMIALPGLTLVNGRAAVARSILLGFAKHLDRGMLPNRFPEAGESPEYNTVDATLWFFEAVRSLLHSTGDFGFVKDHLYGKLQEAIQWHLRGTRYGIRADADGLLAAGEPGVQLTWMDAKVGDWVVTPRHGKPVEIQALWYNALRIMEDLAARFGHAGQAAAYGGLADGARESFNARFWNPQAGCLFDVIADTHRDASVRPNQVFAVSLHHTMLAPERARQVVETVRRELWTPLGLRSLSPRDPAYRPRYEGGVMERDSAYHQGTVWPWLLGPFISACVKVYGDPARKEAAGWLAHLHEHLSVAGLGQISEIADAEPPHEPRGCIAQAWSVAEWLRAAVEDCGGLQRLANWSDTS
ncbi:MAG: glycogen debranching enzyme family protein [Bryobacterales bacterium]|nr:glycogen debranching enzyme family protein [Bryobacterales bacterium]